MASPISTGGFSVQSQPGINYLPPSAFSSGSADILPNISNGAKLIPQLQGIRDEAQLRPILQQLQQIKLAEAQGRLEQLPMENKIRQASYLQQIAKPIITSSEPQNADIYREEIGGDGEPTGRMITIAGPDVMNERGYTIGDSGLIPYENQRIIKDAETKRAALVRQGMLDEALVNQKDAYAASLLAKADNASNPDNAWIVRTRGTKTDGGSIINEEINKNTGEIRYRDTGLKPLAGKLDAIGAALKAVQEGGNQPAPANIAAPSQGKAMFTLPGINAAPVTQDARDTVAEDADTVAVDAETQALIDSLSQGAAPAAAPSAFNTPAEAEAAAAAGLIKKGQKITVGGRSATWQ